jgi:hypothetical protein
MLIILVVLYLFDLIDVAQAIQIILTFALVSVTAVYVRRTAEIANATKQQAEASIKMAKEMENSRYDTVRPVIDIEVKTLSNIELAKQAYTQTGQLELPKNLYCRLSNIGLGPAIDTYSFTLLDDDKPARQKFGVLKVQDELTKVSLRLEQREEDWLLVVYYRDIYGRSFVSTRGIIISPDKKAYTFGQLNTYRVKEEENRDD